MFRAIQHYRQRLGPRAQCLQVLQYVITHLGSDDGLAFLSDIQSEKSDRIDNKACAEICMSVMN